MFNNSGNMNKSDKKYLNFLKYLTLEKNLIKLQFNSNHKFLFYI